jgi:[ribosomal protein S5]-alanine N-acetyltransferase
MTVAPWNTKRLTGRPPTGRDLVGYRDLLCDPAVAHWLSSSRGPFTDTELLEWHSGDQRHWQEFGFGPWVLIERESESMIGRGGIRWTEIDGERVVELPWAVGSRHWNQGFATEAVAGAIEWGESLGISELVALIEPANGPSRRVAEKAGLRLGEEIEHEGVPHLVYRIGTPRTAEESRG